MNLNLNQLLLSLVLTPLFAVSTLLPVTQQPAVGITFQPKSRPQKTAGGASRGLCAVANGVSATQTKENKPWEQKFKALIPSTEMEFTTEDYPSILVNYSEFQAADMEFSLFDEHGKGIYQTTIPVQEELSGIINLKFPQAAGSLVVGKEYKWYIAIICNQDERQRDVVLEGKIQRVIPNAQVLNDLAIANPLQKANIYAKNGYWYESVYTLYEQRRLHPENQRFVDEWKQLLDSVGLKELSQVPIANCCEATQ